MSTTETVTFEALGLPDPLLQALKRAGYEAPTPIQRETIPPLLEGRDVLGQAATGTGKTAAFALPILSKLVAGASKPFETQALVLVPTRELALQVSESIKKYSDAMGVSVLAIYGGQEFTVQLRPLKRGVDVVVATPGRAIDHLTRKTLKLDRVKIVVLDEADEMLDMGFAEELEVLLSALPTERQVALFSATMPPRIQKIAERQMKNPVRVAIARALSHGEGQKIRQVAYVVPRRQKVEALLRVLELEQPTSALVFCRTRADVDELASVLDEHGLATEALHGGLSQDQRDRVMKKFKSGVVKYVVATDVAARGIHVDNLSHVINADVPTSPEVYVHRIGRTGRAGREGVAITFAEPGEVRLIKGLERAAGGRLQQMPVPTDTQVKAKKLKATQQAVKTAMEAGEGARMRAWVESLGEGLPAAAAAAMELLHRSLHNEPAEAPGAAEPRPSAERTWNAAADTTGGERPARRQERFARGPDNQAHQRWSGESATQRSSGASAAEAVHGARADQSDSQRWSGEGARASAARPAARAHGANESSAATRNTDGASGTARASGPRSAARVHSDGDEPAGSRASSPRSAAGGHGDGDEPASARASSPRSAARGHGDADEAASPRSSGPRSAARGHGDGDEGAGARSSSPRAVARAHADDDETAGSRESDSRSAAQSPGAEGQSPRATGPRMGRGHGDRSAASGDRDSSSSQRGNSFSARASAPRSTARGETSRQSAEASGRDFSARRDEVRSARSPIFARPSKADGPRRDFERGAPARRGLNITTGDEPRSAQSRDSQPANRFERQTGPRGTSAREPSFGERTRDRERPERPARNDRPGRSSSKGEEPMSRGKPSDVVTLWVGAGTDAGIRAGDIVGAIANEAGLNSRQIGPIEIKEGYSLVGVPSVTVEAVIDALSSTKLRGRKIKVRREKP